MAERELGAFIGAVTELFGPEQARLSAENWLDELALMDTPPEWTSRDWRRVTVAAAARLANRPSVSADHRTTRGEPPILFKKGVHHVSNVSYSKGEYREANQRSTTTQRAGS